MYNHHDINSITSIKPIFESLEKQNIDKTIIAQVFFDTGIKDFFPFVPHSLQRDVTFVHTCIEKNMLSFDDLPLDMQNTNVVSKQQYLTLIGNQSISLTKNLYQQDYDIALCAAKHYFFYEKDIAIEFKEHIDIISQAAKNDPYILNNIDGWLVSEIKSDDKLMASILQANPDCYSSLTEDEKKHTPYLKAMLTSDKGLALTKNYLYKNNDPEIALAALKINNNAIKSINKKFSAVIKEHDAKNDGYNFLKTYLLHNKIAITKPNKTKKAQLTY